MGEQLYNSAPSRNSESASLTAGKRAYKRKLVAFTPKNLHQSTYRHITRLTGGRGVTGAAGHVAIFLLKVAALETVRRVSSAKCPYVWRGFQALQVLCYPPLNFIQRWAPFNGLIRGIQMLSRPLLVLSIATAFSDQVECPNETSDGNGASAADSELHSDVSTIESTLETRICEEASHNPESDNWFIQLHKELESQGISLPERMNKEELHRFYVASNGKFSSLVSSIKKTIRWRETYRILSEEELEAWSNMVFWHGYDVKNRPCLIVRLGLACLNLPSHERPCFAQAVISQVEHGVLHLVSAENPEVTVLVDCEGLSPLRVPMQIMRSCSSLLQDHFPNCLGCLFVVRLPPVIRVIAKTFIQVLKPVTRKKLKILGEMYPKVLSEYLQALPSYLGGRCTCTKCASVSAHDMRHPNISRIYRTEVNEDVSDSEDTSSSSTACLDDIHLSGSCDQVLRTAIIGMLMLWVLIAFIAGLSDPESRPF